MGIQQSLALAVGERREAQAEIGQGNVPALPRQHLDDMSQTPPDGQLPGIGQPGYAPQQPGRQPGDPVARAVAGAAFGPAGFGQCGHGIYRVASGPCGWDGRDYGMKGLCYYRRNH